VCARPVGNKPASIAAAMLAARTACIDLIRADTRCSTPGSTLTQKTTFRIFDAGSATSPTAIDTNIKLSVIR
jgi:hypothetical protein